MTAFMVQLLGFIVCVGVLILAPIAAGARWSHNQQRSINRGRYRCH